MKVETIGGKILAATIVVYLLWTGTATGETGTYIFDPNQSTVVRAFLTSDTYTLTGAFQLTVDTNSGSFDWVNATFSDDPNLQTGDLRELFYMDELVGDVVNDTTIEFGFPPGHPVLQSYDIHITVTFQNDQVHLAGYRNPLMVGEPGFTLDAVANEAIMYDLTVTVVSGHGTVDPISGSYTAGTVVTLTATPEACYYVVRQWTGTDDDTSYALTNTVTMDSDKTVTVEFESRRMIIKVPLEYTTIQGAIDAAACGDMLIVSPGVHNGNINFNGKNITITSSNPDDPMVVASTIIQGSGAGPVVTFSGSENQSCVLEGITITDGNTTGDGGGICGNGTEATVANCVITNNHADGYGGGLSDCDGTITRCIITGNTAGSGGGMYYNGGSPVLTNCTFTENLAVDGGAIYISGDFSGTFTDCMFENNAAAREGGAIFHKGYGESNIIRCEFRNCSAERGGAIYKICDSLVLSECILVSNQAEYAGAIYSSGDITLTNCLLVNNQALVWGGALANMINTSRSVNCTFVGNSANYGGAIFSNIECDTTAINSIFWNNTAQTGSQIATSGSHGGSTLTINNCDIEHLLDGLHVPNGCTLIWGGGNIDDEPLFADSNNGNYRLSNGSPCIDTGDNTAVPPTVLTDLDGNPRITNGTVDMGAYEFQGIQILYVDDDAAQFGNGASWATAFKYLQDALFNAVPPAEIRVAQGIYKPDQGAGVTRGDRKATFHLINGVTIKGGYAGIGSLDPNTRDIELYETILSGDLSGNDVEVTDPCDLLTEPTRAENSYHVVTSRDCDQTAILDGFTITAGNATSRRGGGINFGDSRSLIINCTFEGNSATDSGGAATICDTEPAPIFINCDFNKNATEKNGGGLWSDESNPILTDCKFTENWAGGEGGGIYGGAETMTNCSFFKNSAQVGGGVWLDTRATLTNCIFAGNLADYGGGMHSERYSLIFTNCVFNGNKVKNDGGGMHNSETSTFTNCMFIGNYAGRNGGGIYNFDYCHPTFSNCTFSGNYADGAGGGLYNGDDTGAILTNCILWADTPNEIDLWIGGTAVITYSDVEGGWPGLGNIDVDPSFIDPDGADNVFGTEDDNLRLSFGSPCIDTGDPGYVTGPNETDLDGNPRVIGGRIDMGAYEFFGPVYVDDDGPNDPGPGDPQVSDPLENGTEAHPFDTIQEGINMAKEGYIVLVRQGSYSEPGTGNYIDFYGKNITLTSTDPTDWDIVDNTVILGYVQFSGIEDPNCKFAGFKIQNIEGAIYGNHTHATISHCNISGNGPCGATVIKDCDGTISNCLITDNTTFFKCGVFPVVFGCDGVIKNCTIANNISGVSVGSATIKNCIIYNNIGSQLDVGDLETLNISYCNLQGGLEGITGGGIVNWGPGNINTDPCFVRLGYWIMDEMTLIEGDYHLRSEGWRWNTEGKSWTYDYFTSRCIDAGNPASDLGDELMSVPRDPSNVWGVNLRINMGTYGGTGQAGMPPHGWALLADLNNDGTANFVDFAYQAQDWLTTEPEQPGDLNRDGLLNKMDLALLAEEWLQVTFWCEY